MRNVSSAEQTKGRRLTAVDPEAAGFQETVNGLEVLDDVASGVEEEAGDTDVPRAC